MLGVSQKLGAKEWTKAGTPLLTMEELNLKPGDTDGDLVRTKEAVRKLGLKLCVVLVQRASLTHM